jgi:nitrogenase molybdenum-iron protein beta chain
MGNIVNPRAGCALHGALAALEAIEGVIPIVHANAGCAMQHALASRNHGGYIEGLAVPSSNIIDKQVIFGGGSRLREQIKNTVKVVDGQLYVVVGSCECAMVGDDLIGMAREAAGQGLPVANSNIAGFHGGVHRGYERVFLDLIESLPELESTPLHTLPPQVADPRPLVNLFGIVPGGDPYYKGDVEELRRILEAIGLRVNGFFGPGGHAALRGLARANLNLVFSRWGEAIGARLEEKYGTPQLIFDAMPLGIEDVSFFAQTLVERLDLDAAAAERFLEREEALEEYFLLGAAERYFDEGTGKRAAIVGDSETVLRIGGFLSRFAAVDIRTAIHTDRDEDEEVPAYFDGEACATRDSGEIAERLLASGADLIFASSLEAETAQALGAPLLVVSHPLRDRAVGGQTYAGLRGAVALGADFLTLIRQARRGREEEARRRIAGAGSRR